MAKKPQNAPAEQPSNPNAPVVTEVASVSDPFGFDDANLGLSPAPDLAGGMSQEERKEKLNRGEDEARPSPFPVVKEFAANNLTDTSPQNNPPVSRVPEIEVFSRTLSESEKVDLALNSTQQPISKNVVAAARLGLEDLSVEEQVDLAVHSHEIIGKAAGHLPDFHSATENMKGAYMSVVRDIWLAAQRKTRSFNE